MTRQSSFPNAGRQTSGLPAKTRSERRIRCTHRRLALACTSEHEDALAGGSGWRVSRAIGREFFRATYQVAPTHDSTGDVHANSHDKRPEALARVLHPVNDSFPRSTPLSVQSAFFITECAANFNRSLCAILKKRDQGSGVRKYDEEESDRRTQRARRVNSN